jgi:hypothetical protein
MVSVTAILKTLENMSQGAEFQHGTDWAEFRCSVGTLADRFKAIAGKETPALAELERAVAELLEISDRYPRIAGMLGPVGEVPPPSVPEGGGAKRPPSSNAPDTFDVKETANRYYSLLGRLKGTIGHVLEDSDAHRTHA